MRARHSHVVNIRAAEEALACGRVRPEGTTPFGLFCDLS